VREAESLVKLVHEVAAALLPPVDGLASFACRITALHHKALDDPVKMGPVIVAFKAELYKVAACLRAFR
jgi:hypothetical protein